MTVGVVVSPEDTVTTREFRVRVSLVLADHVWNVRRSSLEPVHSPGAVCGTLDLGMVPRTKNVIVVRLAILDLRLFR